jgi:hypothetical protein
MSDSQTDRNVQPWYREPWPWFLIGVPLATVIAGIATLVIAIRSPNALVVDDYYKAGLAINQEKERLNTAKNRNIEGLLRADHREVSFLFTDEDTERPGSLTLSVIHATRADLDRSYSLEPAGADRYRASWEPLTGGNWYFRLEPESGEWEIRAESRIEGAFQLRMAGEE